MEISFTSALPLRKSDMKIKIGYGYDIHRLEKGDSSLLLAGVKVSSPYQVIAHSDGDALYHSLANALLSIVGAGDIGTYFPDNSEKTKDMDSREIVLFAKEECEKRGYEIISICVDIILEAVRLSPYREKIQNSLSSLFSLEKEDVNVAFNTKEGLGAVGQNEAIEVTSLVTVKKD